jgi:hypothetical protein
VIAHRRQETRPLDFVVVVDAMVRSAAGSTRIDRPNSSLLERMDI